MIWPPYRFQGIITSHDGLSSWFSKKMHFVRGFRFLTNTEYIVNPSKIGTIGLEILFRPRFVVRNISESADWRAHHEPRVYGKNLGMVSRWSRWRGADFRDASFSSESKKKVALKILILLSYFSLLLLVQQTHVLCTATNLFPLIEPWKYSLQFAVLNNYSFADLNIDNYEAIPISATRFI